MASAGTGAVRRSGLRAAAALVWLAFGACSARGERVAEPRPGRVGAAEPAPRPACGYELAGAPRSLIAQVSGRHPSVDVAAAGETVLAVNQAWDGERRVHSIRARLSGPRAPTAELVLSADGTFTTPRILSQGERFFVWWLRQSPDGAQGRWVEQDGTLGAIVEIPLPLNLGASLATTASGFSMVFLQGREGGDTLQRQLFDRSFAALGPSLAIDDTQRFDGASIGQHVRPNGEIWVWAVGTGRKRSTDQVHFVRMSAEGEVLAPVAELTDTDLEAARVSMLSTPGGALMAWIEEKEVGMGPVTLFARKLDDRGTPVGSAIRMAAGATRFDAPALVRDGGAPLLVADGGRHIRLDEEGAARSLPFEPIPVEVNAAFWLGSSGSPSVAWVEPRGGESGELMLAPLRCVAERR